MSGDDTPQNVIQWNKTVLSEKRPYQDSSKQQVTHQHFHSGFVPHLDFVVWVEISWLRRHMIHIILNSSNYSLFPLCPADLGHWRLITDHTHHVLLICHPITCNLPIWQIHILTLLSYSVQCHCTGRPLPLGNALAMGGCTRSVTLFRRMICVKLHPHSCQRSQGCSAEHCSMMRWSTHIACQWFLCCGWSVYCTPHSWSLAN